MFELESLEVGHWISRYVYPFARVSGLLMVMPLIGTRMVPQRIRIFLALMVSLVLTPLLPPMPKVDAVSLASMMIVAQQLLIGIAMGFVIELVTQIYVIAGQLIAMQTGLGIATTVDPSQGASVVVISQWFLFMVSMVFLALDGHLIMLEILADSFHTLPVGFDGLEAADFGMIVEWSGWMFAAAVVISLPALTSLLVVNLAFGVMTRAAPQLNIFALGFPVTMIVGLFIMWLNIGEMAQGFHVQMEAMFEFLKKLTRG